MTDFAAARRNMVDGQVRTADVTDPRILSAMLEIPRENFVPQASAALAYLDLDLPVGESGTRRLLKPMVLAKLIHAADVVSSERVLDVGCATGYSSAILGRLAGSVVALEQDATLARRAEENLLAVGAQNVTVVIETMAAGWPAGGPYDVVVLNGASEVLPKTLLGQLKSGGRLVGVIGRSPTSKAMFYRSVGGEVSGRPIFDATAAPLPGFAEPAVFVF